MYDAYTYAYGFDWTYLLLIVAAIFSLIAQTKVKSTYNKYSKVRSMTGMTGREAAERILAHKGIRNVEIRHVSGTLTDHYNPANNTVNLSDAVYNDTSIAALGVAAHECGHAIQHSKQYAPLGIRSALVPVANFGATISWPLVLLGLFMNANLGKALIIAGVLMFFAAVMFHVITLPVEFDASRRALKNLREFNLVDEGEVEMARKVLTAAALTYVAGTISALLQFLRLLLIVRSYTDDDE
jgi:Zn-dependent membrane protease YugP